VGFAEDFRRFFVRGLATLMPTLITLWLLIWAWNFLWLNIGRHIIAAFIWVWLVLVQQGLLPNTPLVRMRIYWWSGQVVPTWAVQLIGVGLAILLVYIVGLLVGNLIGRTMWRLAERAVMRIPLVRAIYPAVKQVTDLFLAEKKAQFASSQVVAVQPHARGIWSIGLVTGAGLRPLSERTGEEMVTVFVPSSPTAFSGYVLVVPRDSVVQLPLKVDEAMRLLVSGGVIAPGVVPPGSAIPAAAASLGAGDVPHGEPPGAGQPELLADPAARLANR
jgi:uncharacterized membrane protein